MVGRYIPFLCSVHQTNHWAVQKTYRAIISVVPNLGCTGTIRYFRGVYISLDLVQMIFTASEIVNAHTNY